MRMKANLNIKANLAHRQEHERTNLCSLLSCKPRFEVKSTRYWTNYKLNLKHGTVNITVDNPGFIFTPVQGFVRYL